MAIVNHTAQILQDQGITYDKMAKMMIEAGYTGKATSAHNAIGHFCRQTTNGTQDIMLEYVCTLLNVSISEVLELKVGS